MAVKFYSNVSKLMSLQVAVNNSATSIVVDDASGLPASFPFNVALDYLGASVEIVSVTAVASNVLTVVRGQEDTVGTSHSVGAVVAHVGTATDLKEANDHINSSGDVHGIGPAGAVVGTVTAQTLTNKTISGSLNTLSAIPRTALTGIENNLTVGQSLSGSPALTVTPNGAPGADIISATYYKMDLNGVNRFIGKSAAADVVRIYDTTGANIRAKIDETGKGTFIGVTSTGLIQADGGITLTSPNILTTNSGSTVTVNGTATFSGTTSFGSSSVVTFNSGPTFGNSQTTTWNLGTTIQMNGTTNLNAAVNLPGTVTATSASTVNLNGTLQRDSVAAKPLMYTSTQIVPASNVTASATFVDLTGITDTFTVPAGRTATVEVVWQVNILCNTAGNTAEWLPVIDGTAYQSATTGVALTFAAAANLGTSFTFITSLAAGSHTIKIQEKHSSGAANMNYRNPWCSMTIKAFW